MIWYSITFALVDAINILTSWLPHVLTLDTISEFGKPFVNLGSAMDSSLVTLFGYLYAVLAVLWPLAVVWSAMLVYFSVKGGLWALKFVPWVGTRIQL
jgi:hypothetical protein